MTGELVPGISVAVRLGVLQGVRLLAAAVAVFALDARGRLSTTVGALVLAWALLTTLAELARRTWRSRARAIGALLVLDVAVLAAAADATGGARSPLLGVVYLHVVLVASLIGTLTGLRIALLHAFALYLVHAAATARAGAAPYPGLAATHAVGYLLVAGGAALCGHLQTRAARWGRAELRALADLGPTLGAARSADGVAAALAHTVVASFGFSRAAVLHGTDAGWRAVLADDAPVDVEARDLETDPTVIAALTSLGAITRRALRAGTALDALLPGAADVAIVGVDSHPMLLVVAEWDLGRGHALRTETLTAITEATNHAALAISACTLREELERLATHDGLTALINRSTFDQRLADALADRRAQPVSIALVDLDHFKAVNDTYGHQVGDDVLRRAADALRAVVRPSDTAARYGGEELVVILPGCASADAEQIAERLRTGIAASGDDPVVTASIGVATGSAGTSADELLAAADQALYRAKQTGRDRVVVAGQGRRRSPTSPAHAPGTARRRTRADVASA